MEGVEIGRDHAAGRRSTGMVVALAASGLSGMLLGGWINQSALLTVSPARAARAPASVDSSAILTPVLGAALVLLLVAALLVRRSGATVPDAVPRDPLTGLYLAPFVAESLRNQFAREDREGHSRVALVLIEIDRLDRLRERYGDGVMRDAVALLGRQIRSQVRLGDLPMRHADEHFAVYLQCDEREQAEAFCRRLAMLLAGDQLDLNGDVVKLTTNTAIALRETGEPLEALSDRAQGLLQRPPAVGAVSGDSGAAPAS